MVAVKEKIPTTTEKDGIIYFQKNMDKIFTRRHLRVFIFFVHF